MGDRAGSWIGGVAVVSSISLDASLSAAPGDDDTGVSKCCANESRLSRWSTSATGERLGIAGRTAGEASADTRWPARAR
jgi:hypothetical protein